MGTWAEDIEQALTKLGGVGTLAEIYHQCRVIRPNWREVDPTAKTGDAHTVRQTLQTHSSDSSWWQKNPRSPEHDLFFSAGGRGEGVWGLRSMVLPTPVATDQPEDAPIVLSDGNASPGKTRITAYRTLRDTALARQIKLLHKNACQLCGEVLHLTGGRTYSEAHHIIPLNKGHDGPDVPWNIIVLCPNHHALLDYGAIRLDRSEITAAEGHWISDESISYHNERIYAGASGDAPASILEI